MARWAEVIPWPRLSTFVHPAILWSPVPFVHASQAASAATAPVGARSIPSTTPSRPNHLHMIDALRFSRSSNAGEDRDKPDDKMVPPGRFGLSSCAASSLAALS